jgi:hypothetical protein
MVAITAMMFIIRETLPLTDHALEYLNGEIRRWRCTYNKVKNYRACLVKTCWSQEQQEQVDDVYV